MSKKSRKADNSKRQQPIQQQRAQARLPSQGQPKQRESHQKADREKERGSTEALR